MTYERRGSNYLFQFDHIMDPLGVSRVKPTSGLQLHKSKCLLFIIISSVGPKKSRAFLWKHTSRCDDILQKVKSAATSTGQHVLQEGSASLLQVDSGA